MQTIYRNFFKIPFNIYNLNLSSKELSVLIYLFYLSNNNIIHPSKQTIAKNTNLSKRTIDKVIISLVKKGFIEYNRGFIKDTRKVCNQYRILIENFAPKCIEKSIKQIELEDKNNAECINIIRESIIEYGS